MSEPFDSASLPAPLAAPAGDTDSAAEELAAKIAANDGQSTAAFLTALEIAGFSVRDLQGNTLLEPAGAPQGIAFDNFTVAALSKLYGEGIQISFTRFCSTSWHRRR